jgi:general secretion pathway protein A
MKMYKQFFGLIRNPFEIAPDPYFLFSTACHNEALASILHGVQRRKGFMVVTGEVGTGKTLLVRCLLEIMRQEAIAFTNVFNPCLSALEFLRYVGGDLGLKTESKDKGLLLLELNSHLIARHCENSTTVLIVDEAQSLAPELLEEIRLLTNLETSKHKLLQIILVGQPELDQKLDSHELRQLKQRVSLRCQLKPLKPCEATSYILRRLQRAGANSRATIMFPEETMTAVYRYSNGIPRLINTICENALIAAYAEKAQVVRPPLIDEVATDLRLEVRTSPPMSALGVTGMEPAISKPLLDLVKATHPDQGVKIV